MNAIESFLYMTNAVSWKDYDSFIEFYNLYRRYSADYGIDHMPYITTVCLK